MGAGIILLVALAITYLVLGLVELSGHPEAPIGWASIATGVALVVFCAARVSRQGLPLRRDDER